MNSSASGIAPAIEVAGLSKTFGARKALDDIRVSIAQGEMVALIGASGSGKSTLMRHIAGLVVGDAGVGGIRILGSSMQNAGVLDRRARTIRVRLGFVFQQFNLVSRLPVLTNVLTGTLGRLPLWRSLLGLFPQRDRDLALEALRRVGIAETAGQRASTLSGGQQQRAAIARTLVQQARVILADEPIASLDPESSRRVMEILSRINAEDGTTVLVSLHQVEFAIKYCPRTIALKDGKVVYDGPSRALTHDMLLRLYGSAAEELEGQAAAPATAALTSPLLPHMNIGLAEAA
jgi:phosphonate transport system ATP-binding protein